MICPCQKAQVFGAMYMMTTALNFRLASLVVLFLGCCHCMIISNATVAAYTTSDYFENQPAAVIEEDREPLYLSFNASRGDSYLSELRITLFEKDMINQVRYVTYSITIRDMADNSTVMRDVFHTPTGTAVVRLVQVGEENDTNAVANITGIQEPYLNA
jgi:hypothetical protein